jgi:hypothetical protein
MRGETWFRHLVREAVLNMAEAVGGIPDSLTLSRKQKKALRKALTRKAKRRRFHQRRFARMKGIA